MCTGGGNIVSHRTCRRSPIWQESIEQGCAECERKTGIRPCRGKYKCKNGKAYYVSIEKGSARGAGTKEAPMKDIQKAIDSAADGDVIRIAQGNYLGPLDRGWIQIKGKYVSLEGGWNGDFTERNPVKYITRIQPSGPGTADD